MNKSKKNFSVTYNQYGLPIIKSKKNAQLTFQFETNKEVLHIIGNRVGLKLLAKTLFGLAETKKIGGFHIHIDDLYEINNEDKSFILHNDEL